MHKPLLAITENDKPSKQTSNIYIKFMLLVCFDGLSFSLWLCFKRQPVCIILADILVAAHIADHTEDTAAMMEPAELD